MMNLEIRNGIILAFGGFLWLLMENALGLHQAYLGIQPFIFWMIILLPLAMIYQSLKYRRDKLQSGTITLIDALKSSLTLSGVASLMAPLFVWLYVSVVNPSYLLIRKDAELKALDETNLNDATFLLRKTEIEQQFTTLSYLFSAFVFSIAVCLVLSIIISVLIRKKPVVNLNSVKSGETVGSGVD
jgi:hypothetical protein